MARQNSQEATPKMKLKVTVACFSLLLIAAFSTSTAHAQKAPVFTTVDVPGAMETDVNDVNTAGVLVGYECSDALCDSGGTAKAWVQVNGTFKFIRIPGATQSRAYGINDKNQVVGWYIDASGITHGFMFDKGVVTTIDPPGSTLTNAWSINQAGGIVGAYTDSSGVFHGFTDRAGTFTTFDAPNGAILTEFTGINNTNQRVGIYIDANSVQHGFTLINNTFADVSFPGANVVVTAADRINDSGQIVGLWGTNTAGPFKGYTRVGTKFTSIVVPQSTETRLRGLNNAGLMTGRYTDTAGFIHGVTIAP
jgi:probable HAF family extracellular repeat protein